MHLRILFLFFISLSLNAAEIVWDADTAKKAQKISGNEYQSALDFYIDDLKRNPAKAFEKGVQAEKKQEYKSALYFYRLSANQAYLPAQHNLAFMYANNLGITKSDIELIKLQALEAQKALKKLNYEILAVDGIYGNQTLNTIKSFQKDIGIPQTGWVDKKLLNELKNPEVKAKIQAIAIDKERALEIKAALEAKLAKDKVRANTLEAQQLLNDLGYYLGALDGNYGPTTARAIKNYQRDISIIKNGVVSNSLIYSLRKSYKQYLKQLNNDKSIAAAGYNEGVKAYSNGSYVQAARLYKLSSNQGNAKAQYNLGEMYQYGSGVKQDKESAARFFKLSADQGNVSAKKRLELLCKSHPSSCR